MTAIWGTVRDVEKGELLRIEVIQDPVAAVEIHRHR